MGFIGEDFKRMKERDISDEMRLNKIKSEREMLEKKIKLSEDIAREKNTIKSLNASQSKLGKFKKFAGSIVSSASSSAVSFGKYIAPRLKSAQEYSQRVAKNMESSAIPQKRKKRRYKLKKVYY